MTEPCKSEDDVPLRSSVLNGAVPLESILCTEELQRRPSRPPNYEKENRALVALVSALADSPHMILQVLAGTILEITQSESAGLSLLTRDDGKRFYWPAIAGVWKPHVGGGTPRDFGPCGDVLDRNRTLLFKHFERRYPYLRPVMPPAEECLLVPFYLSGKAVGTIWAIMHSDRRKFDAEDERIMESLGKFASSAYQAVVSIDDLKFQIAEREKTGKELHELTEGLETQVRARTEQLEQRNKQLAEARARLAEEKLGLERSQAYLAAGERLSHTGSWHWDVGTGKVVASRECFAIFGFDSETKEGAYSLFIERVHPEDRGDIEKLVWTAVNKKRDWEAEFRLLLPNGAIKYLHDIAHCVVSPSDDVQYFGIAMDITERKRSEEALRRSESYLAEAQKLTHTGSWAGNVITRKIFHSSDEHARLYGLDPGNGLPSFEDLLQRVHPEDRARFIEAFEHASAAGKDADVRYRVVLADGATKYVQAVGHPVLKPSGEAGEFVGFLMDVTERHQADQERERLRQVQADLARINRVSTMGELTASLAHEIKQPISAASTDARTCLRWLARQEPDLGEAREAALRLIKDVSRASDFINRIGSMFKKDVVQRQLMDVNELIKEMIVLLRSEAAQHSIQLHGELTNELPAVMADRIQLQQVLMNLIVNGIEAMRDIRLPGKLTISSLAVENRQILVSVRDTGVGLPAERTEQIFDAFFTLKSQGTGMGLPICRSIIESHGGRLWATSNSGPGATFQFTLPVEVAAHQSA